MREKRLTFAIVLFGIALFLAYGFFRGTEGRLPENPVEFTALSTDEKNREEPETLILGQSPASGQTAGRTLNLKTIAAHPHDRGAYTQGLIFHEGFLYESTGQYGKTTLRKVEIASGKTLQSVALKADFFGEGIERVGDKIYFLTWQEGRCFVFDRETLAFQKSFRYPGEGWGLAYDGEHLILSDGSAKLRFYDPNDFTLKKTVEVYDGETRAKGRKIAYLNELEMVEGELWANVWKTDRIARIDPASGRVLGYVHCGPFIPKELQKEHADPRISERVLNGIAYDSGKKRLYITGKEWPVLYELQVSFSE